jgi:hypothetical protein
VSSGSIRVSDVSRLPTAPFWIANGMVRRFYRANGAVIRGGGGLPRNYTPSALILLRQSFIRLIDHTFRISSSFPETRPNSATGQERAPVLRKTAATMGAVMWSLTQSPALHKMQYCRPCWKVSALCLLTWVLLGLAFLASASQGPADYFKIVVVDQDTGRGVPLVELRTTYEVSYYTDSNGIVAFYEPGLMNQSVWFFIQSHGYEYPQDFLGNRGTTLQITPGGTAVLKIKRLNIAERLYRLTGEGIYRDSVLTGERVPIRQPTLNAQVAGQDGAQTVLYHGKVYWFFGDTGKVSFPLGNFAESGAVSELPGHGGLDPSVGVDLKYFVDDSGFSRAMCSKTGDGLEWLFWAGLVRDANGWERLAGECRRMKGLGEELDRTLVLFNDDTQKFEPIQQLSLNAQLRLDGRPFLVSSGGHDYQYFPTESFPAARVQADLVHLTHPSEYEGYSCLLQGTRVENANFERGSDGRLVCGWKRDTPPLNYKQQQDLIAAGKLKPQEGLIQLRDFQTATPIAPFGATVEWNSYRKRWIMLLQRRVGQIWYAEGDTPLGPWVYSTRVVMHDRYDFYLPVQHPFFAQEHGRLIYFEATYTDFFSSAAVKTPRYDYNQIMYRLALDDSRLFLPAPVYRVVEPDGLTRYELREDLESQNEWQNVQETSFFAMPPDRRREGLIPVFSISGERGTVLALEPPKGTAIPQPLFYALPARPPEPGPTLAGTWNCKARGADGSEFPFTLEFRVERGIVRGRVDQDEIREGTFREDHIAFQINSGDDTYRVVGRLEGRKLAGDWQETSSHKGGTWAGTADQSGVAWMKSHDVTPLYEYHSADGTRIYSTESKMPSQRLQRSADPICLVWRNPASLLIVDRDAKPVPE